MAKRWISLLLALAMAVSAMAFGSPVALPEPDRSPEKPYVRSDGPEAYGAVRKKIMETFEDDSVDKEFRRGEMMVKLKASGHAGMLEDEYGLTVDHFLGIDNELKSVLIPDGADYEDVLARLNSDPRVLYAEPNYVHKALVTHQTEPRLYRNWGIENREYDGIDINIMPLWNSVSSLSGLKEVVVGVIDSGVDYTHPDIDSRIWRNKKEIAGNGKDDDRNGYVDDIRGWDFADDDRNPKDGAGHGTHVAGVLAAEQNGRGVMGVAPNVKIMPLKFLDDNGLGDARGVVEAIHYGKKMGVKLFNCSYGSYIYSAAEYDEMNDMDCLFIVASGNESADNDSKERSYPSSFNLSNIISVGSIDEDGTFSSYSNYGKKNVDICAPGRAIYSCMLQSTYGVMSGTSMATPYVTGTAALCMGIDPKLTMLQVRRNILSSTHKLPKLSTKTATSAIIDTSGAIGLSDPSRVKLATSFDISPSSIALYVGDTSRISSGVLPYSSFEKWITWSSDAPWVASVDEAGNVTGNTPGKATISARVGKSMVRTCPVTVEVDGDKAYGPSDRVRLSVKLPAEYDRMNGEVTFIKPDGRSSSYSISYDGAKQAHSVSLSIAGKEGVLADEIDGTRDSGRWTADRILLYDESASRYMHIYSDDLYSVDAEGSMTYDLSSLGFTVGHDVDSGSYPPYEGSPALDPSAVSPVIVKVETSLKDVYRGNIQTIRVYARGDEGFDRGKIELVNDGGTGVELPIVNNGRDGYLYADVVSKSGSDQERAIDPAISSGEWRVKSVRLTEAGGHETVFCDERSEDLESQGDQIPVDMSGGDFTLLDSDKAADRLILTSGGSTVRAYDFIRIDGEVQPSDSSLSEIEWRSSDTDVATVDSRGYVKGFIPGKVTITASLKGDSSVSSSMEVVVLMSDRSSILSASGALRYVLDQDVKSLKLYVPYSTRFYDPGIKVSKGATWEIFADEGLQSARGHGVELGVGDSTFYVAVTAQDGMGKSVYRMAINRMNPQVAFAGKPRLSAGDVRFGGSRTLGIETYARMGSKSTIYADIYNSRNKRVATLKSSRSASSSLVFRWNGRPTAGNEAGLSSSRTVPVGRSGEVYKVRLRTQNESGSYSTEYVKFRVYQ